MDTHHLDTCQHTHTLSHTHTQARSLTSRQLGQVNLGLQVWCEFKEDDGTPVCVRVCVSPVWELQAAAEIYMWCPAAVGPSGASWEEGRLSAAAAAAYGGGSSSSMHHMHRLANRLHQRGKVGRVKKLVKRKTFIQTWIPVELRGEILESWNSKLELKKGGRE